MVKIGKKERERNKKKRKKDISRKSKKNIYTSRIGETRKYSERKRGKGEARKIQKDEDL